jgi:hypothetical protein
LAYKFIFGIAEGRGALWAWRIGRRLVKLQGIKHREAHMEKQGEWQSREPNEASTRTHTV